MSPLLGGEFVIAFLALRIAFWVWRSRADLGALLRGDGPPDPDGGKPLEVPRLRLVPPPIFSFICSDVPERLRRRHLLLHCGQRSLRTTPRTNSMRPVGYLITRCWSRRCT